MIYELRIYHAAPGKLPELNERFERHTLPKWKEHGICPIGFWTCYIGPSSNTLTYILSWADLAARERIWNAFASDPEWIAAKAETEKDGVLVDHLENMILTPTSYSNLQ
jgi:hypothetical protein